VPGEHLGVLAQPLIGGGLVGHGLLAWQPPDAAPDDVQHVPAAAVAAFDAADVLGWDVGGWPSAAGDRRAKIGAHGSFLSTMGICPTSSLAAM
jgi:hypothetical protein